MSDSDSDELLTRKSKNIFNRHQNKSTMVSVAGNTGVNFSYTGANFLSASTSSSFNPNGMGAARSVYNYGRAGSPMSVRSIGTSSSIADVITDALKHENFSKHDLKKIKEAYNKFIRHKVRNRIYKRRYRKPHRHRPRSDEDSGEQCSDSSISSGDRSTRTRHYNGNMSSARSAITDISTFRRTIKDSNMFKDCTESLRHNRKGPGSLNLNNTQMSMMSNRSKLSGFNMPVFKKPANFHTNESKNTSVMLPKDRFTNGFMLPSQRFNKTGNITMIPENVVHANANGHNELPPVIGKESRRNIETDSEEENMFSSHKPSGHINERKRNIDKDDDDIFLPNQKRQKPLPPCKDSIQAQKQKVNAANGHDNADDFIFVKPTFPLQKPVKEKLIYKSAAPSLDTLVKDAINPPANLKTTHVQKVDNEKEKEESNVTQNTSNISMRPSFIKRKLFSQKLDVSEQRNHSTDSLDSPQNSMYGGIQKERKARKLQQATTQSCLNRDLQKDNNNLLDLIQKLVPMDKMSFTHNATNLMNKTDMQSKNLTEDNSERWDVTNIISTHKSNSEGSDTFTDENIFDSTDKELQKKEVSKKNAKVDEEKSVKEILLKDKFTKESASKTKETDTKENGIRRDGVSKETVAKSKAKEDKQQAPILENIFKKPSPIKSNICMILLEKLPPNMNLQPIKGFWDTDSETEAECMPSPKHRNGNSKENLSTKTGKLPKESPKKQGLFSTFNIKKPGQNFTCDNTQKFNASTLKIKSHRAPTRNKFDRTTDQNTILTLREPLFIKQKVNSPPKRIVKQKDTTPKKDKKAQNGKKQVTKNIDPDSAKKIHITNDSTKKQPRKVLNNDKVSHATGSNNNIKNSSENTKNKKSGALKNYEQSEVDKNEKNKDEPKAKTKTSKDKHSKTRKAEMSTSRNNSTLTEDNKNRPVRTCRLNKSNASINITANRTLRSRKVHDKRVNENPSESKNLKKVYNTRDTKTRLSDVSFSLSNDKNAVAKKALKKVTNFSPFKADDSDISFSLKDLSPSPRVTRSNSIVKNKNNVKESIFLRNSPPKAYSLLKDKSIRNRVPNKRYLS